VRLRFGTTELAQYGSDGPWKETGGFWGLQCLKRTFVAPDGRAHCHNE